DGIVSGVRAARSLTPPDAREMELEALRLRSDGQPGAPESSPDGGLVSAERGRDVSQALAGLVTLVEVKDVARTQYVGHVFNLETKQGWYVAGGIITHNCVRVATPYFAG